jgi:hypothetical protein
MQIERSDEQVENALSPRSERLEPGSTATVDKDRHPEKHASPSRPTEEGIQMELSDEQSENALVSIDKRLEWRSNVNIDRD